MNAAYETYSCRDHFQQTDVPVINQVLGSLNEPDIHRSFPARTGFYVQSLCVALERYSVHGCCFVCRWFTPRTRAQAHHHHLLAAACSCHCWMWSKNSVSPTISDCESQGWSKLMQRSLHRKEWHQW